MELFFFLVVQDIRITGLRSVAAHLYIKKANPCICINFLVCFSRCHFNLKEELKPTTQTLFPLLVLSVVIIAALTPSLSHPKRTRIKSCITNSGVPFLSSLHSSSQQPLIHISCPSCSVLSSKLLPSLPWKIGESWSRLINLMTKLCISILHAVSTMRSLFLSVAWAVTHRCPNLGSSAHKQALYGAGLNSCLSAPLLLGCPIKPSLIIFH